GKEPGEGQSQGDPQEQPQGQPQAKGSKKGPAQEKNENKGGGERTADGKVGNASSKSNGLQGDGSFLHLQAREREMIRQALSDHLPPEYAALIQQYYVNIARGRAAPATPATPSAPPR